MSESRYEIELREFGKRLRHYRRKMRFTQLDLEVHSGIDRAEISKIENGKKNIEFTTIIKLAETLDVSTYLLFQFEKNK